MLKNLYRSGWYFQTDDKSGANTEDDSGAESKKEDAGKKSDAEAKKKDDESKAELKFSQADVDKLIKDRLDRAKEAAEKETEKARKKAEEEALEKNKEFEKLAGERQTKITDLEKQLEEASTFKERADKYEGALNGYLVEIKKNLPKHVLPLIEKLDVVDALNYVAQNAKELGVSMVQGVPETPKEKDRKLTDDQKRQAQDAASSLVRRNF